MNGFSPLLPGLGPLTGALIAAALFTLFLVVKAVRDYSLTGPLLPDEILRRYSGYAVWAMARLSFWAFLVAVYWALVGTLTGTALTVVMGWPMGPTAGLIAGLATIAGAVLWRFTHNLLHNPGLLVASSHYRISRFYPLWNHLSVRRLRLAGALLAVAAAALLSAALLQLALAGAWTSAASLLATAAILLGIGLVTAHAPQPPPVAGRAGTPESPNILMIGCDTLRVDRLGLAGYHRSLTPRIDALAARGTWFENCYVPCGRTAPSLISLLTSTWPQHHGIRDNFVGDTETRLTVPSLPRALAAAGYRTAAVSDWCGADLGKFDFGFAERDLPQDSWNLRYLLRQGPKDLRLFLSLFLHNPIGKRLLPEIYYLGGVPSTDGLGQAARQMLNRLAEDNRPFLLNVFFSTTHPPFASEYPYYTLYADRHYAGPSKFAMARLTDPFEIIRRQGEPRKEFDLDQILMLYDGAVKRFDDEVGRLLDHLTACGLAENTLVLLYSDHGMEFFEHDTWGQGNSVLGDHSARIPFILVDPRQPGGHRIRDIVRSVDIAPTLLDLVGQPIPSAMDGVSLARCLASAAPPELPAYTESGIWLTDLPGQPPDHLRYPNLFELLDVPDHRTGTLTIKPQYQDIVIRAKDRMIRLGQWKLTCQPLHDGPRYRLFDLSRDPNCQYDVADRHPLALARLQAILETHFPL